MTTGFDFFCRSFGVIISFFSILFVSCSPSIRMQPVIRVCVRCTETNAIWQPAHTELTIRLCMRWQRLPGVFSLFSVVHSIHTVCVWMCDILCWCQITHTIPFAHIHTQANREPAHWLPCGRTFLMASHENGMRREWQTHRRHCAQSIFRCCVYWIHTHSDMLFARACATTRRRPSISLAPNTYILTFSVRSTHGTLVDGACECVRLQERVCVCGEYFLLVASWDQQFCAVVVLWRRHCCCVYSDICTMVCARVRLHLCYARPNGNSTSHSRYTNLR